MTTDPDGPAPTTTTSTGSSVMSTGAVAFELFSAMVWLISLGL
ncbi:hypothetical protein [Gordonia polyisoprenivorans]|nr:hypothetical protein [Gordonia polyisoprenivorans]